MMLSEFLVQGLAPLRQPRLLRHAPPNMLDGEGVVLPAVLHGLDALFREDAVRQVLEWQMPSDLPFGTRRDDRWSLVSSLQKAIRRGDVRAAMFAAHAVYDLDVPHLLRRLVVCAVEDVMLGNLYGVAATLALAGDVASRRIAGERKTLVWLAGVLAGGWKDRSACNLCVLVEYDRDVHALGAEWFRLADDDLARRVANPNLPLNERMLAAWLLAGTKTFPGQGLPPENSRSRRRLMAEMVTSGMPLVLYYIADRAALRGAGGLFVPLQLLWRLHLENDEPLRLVRGAYQADPGSGGFLLAALDMHTREGKTAISRLASLPGIRCHIDAVPLSTRDLALQIAVFNVEGGGLDLRVGTNQLIKLHRQAIEVEFGYCGLSDAAQRQDLLKAVRRELPQLHRFRRATGFQLTLRETSPVQGHSQPSLLTLPDEAASPPLRAPIRPHGPPIVSDTL